MNLHEAKKILSDEGYSIEYSELEDKAINQMEDIVNLANTLANVVHYFTDSEGNYDIVKLYSYGFDIKNRKTDKIAKIGLLFDKNRDIPKIGVEIDGEVVYTSTKNSAAGLFKMVSLLV